MTIVGLGYTEKLTNVFNPLARADTAIFKIFYIATALQD